MGESVANWGESRNCRAFPGRLLSISCFVVPNACVLRRGRVVRSCEVYLINL